MKLLDFYADWCGPCQALAPILDQFQAKHPDLTVESVNIDERPDLAAEYQVTSIPCLILLDGNQEVDRSVGLISLKTLEKFTKLN